MLEDGTCVAVHWQDADSSSFSAVFPDAEIMICAGHSGRAHRKILESRQKISNSPKSLLRSIEKKFQEQLPDCKKDSHSNTCVRLCHCTGNHSVGCGCLTAECIAKEHKHFTSI